MLKNHRKICLYSSILTTLITTRSFAADVKVRGQLGVLGLSNHRIQFSENNTYFDYVEQGGQDILFNTKRITVEVERENNHRMLFVYQPIELATKVNLEEDIRVDNVSFDAQTPLDLLYSFPYYRFSYLWPALAGDAYSIHAGLGIQARNARIEFASSDGTQLVSNRDLGPVPLLAVHGSYGDKNSFHWQFEAEGLFAPGAYLNGRDEENVKGAIFDAAVRPTLPVRDSLSCYWEFRYISGGSEGTSSSSNNPSGDGYTSNWIDAYSISLGLEVGI